MGLLTKLIDVFRDAPTPEVDARTDMSSPFRGGEINKNNAHWLPEHYSGNSAIAQSWSTVTARVRDLAVNDPLFQKVRNQLCSLVIADGLKAYAAAIDGAGNEIDDYNDESDTWWERWCDDEADADGERSLYEMQRQSFDDMAAVGNCIWLRVLNPDPARISPLCYKLIEWEQLARDYDTAAGLTVPGLPDGHYIQNGIEYYGAGRNKGKKAAFWLYLDHPYDQQIPVSLGLPTRIPAERIIHNYLPSRISDTTGLSWYLAMMQTSRDRDSLVGNTLTATAISALLTLVVKRSATAGLGDPAADLDQVDADTGRGKVGMGYPFIANVGADDDVSVAESKKGLSELSAFSNMLFTLEAMGSKLSLNRVLGDPSQANMASIRAAHEDDDALMSPLRTHQARRFAAGIRKAWTRMAVATGLLKSISAETFNASPWRYLAFEVVGSHRGDVSPQEEIQAAMDRMRSGLTTYPRECARMGSNWRANIRRMAQVMEYAERYDVILDWSKGQGGQVDKSSAAGGEASDQKEKSNAR